MTKLMKKRKTGRRHAKFPKPLHPGRRPVFTFANRRFDYRRGRATFYYRAPDGRQFTERVDFDYPAPLPKDRRPILERALDLAFFLIGTSYYKAHPTTTIKTKRPLSPALATLLNATYQEGLSQYAWENQLTRAELPSFQPNPAGQTNPTNHPDLAGQANHPNHPTPYWRPLPYSGQGKLVLQSGGKDSLLLAAELTEQKLPFRPVYISTSGRSHPAVLDHLGKPLTIITRHLDLPALHRAGGLTGHVPITYIIESLALIQAIIYGYNEVLVSIGDEGAEPHAMLGDLPIKHQWSKTIEAETLLTNFIKTQISPDLSIHSPLRGRSELAIAGDFAAKCWGKYGHSFSSCNVANYAQGHANSTLTWCSHCAKCANAFLLFAPFLPAEELKSTIGAGRDLFQDPALTEIFKGLLGIDGVMKPFECVGEIDELRRAYELRTPGLGPLPFAVPPSNFPYNPPANQKEAA